MEQWKIDRINDLARKAKAEGLTEEETAERAALRKEYVAAVVGNLTQQLDHTWVVDEQGNKRRLRSRAVGEAEDDPKDEAEDDAAAPRRGK